MPIELYSDLIHMLRVISIEIVIMWLEVDVIEGYLNRDDVLNRLPVSKL